MTIFSDQDQQLTRERATRDIALAKPTGFVENMQATWTEFRNNDSYGSLREQRREAWGERIATIERLTGESLDTPWNRFGEDNFFGTFFGLRGASDMMDPEEMGAFDRAVTPWIPDGPMAYIGRMFDGVDNDLSEPERLREHEARIDAIRESLPPDQRSLIPTQDEIEQMLKDRAAQLEADSQDIGSRATLAGVGGRFVGAGGASLTQPEVLVTLPIGAPVRAGLLSKVLIEAGIGAGTEAILQPGVQRQRAELGLESGFGQALENVAVAGAGAGGLTAVLGLISRGGVRAFEAAVGRKATAEERALVHQYQRDSDLQSQIPYEQRDLAAQRVHLQNEQVGYEAALEGRTLGEAEIVADERLVSRAIENEASSVTLLRNDDLEEIGVDADLMQFKAGGDEQGVTERLRGVTQWEVERAGVSLVYEFEDGSRIIADGHQRLGLARRLASEGQEIELPALILREVDGITPAEARARAAFKNIAEGTGSAQDAAKVLRDMGATPEDMGLPPRSALVRDAEGLTRLDDETFGMVINDVLSEQFGAIIGRLVEDPRMQPEIARLLVKLRTANAAEADSVVRQALEAGATRETQSSLFGDEELVQSLFLEKARVLDRGMKMIRRNIDTFRTLSERGGDIQTEGNILNEASNARRLELERMLKDYLQAQAHRKGVIGDALNEAARKAKETGQYAGPAREFVQAVTRAVESGEINGDALSRGGADPQFERAGQAIEAEQAGGPEQIGDDVLDMFSDPVSKATDDQARGIQRELLSEAGARTERTEAGEQTLIEGVDPITDADRLRVQADAPMRGGEAAADDGLFDLMGRGQGDLLDLPVPMGERIVDGERVAETATIRQVFDDLEQDQEFFEQLKLCDGGRG